jgi:hypothetical protein
MKDFRKLRRILVMVAALVPVFVIEAAAQPGTRRSPADVRRATTNDTWRELMKVERETRNVPQPVLDAARLATLKQLKEDFRSIQDVNNRMMAAAWAQEMVDYDRTVQMLSEINSRAVRLKSNLALPEPENTKPKTLAASGVKEFKAALLVMDRSLMNFVTNPIFQERNVVEVNLATKATRDLEAVIAYSANLKKIASHLKNGKANH